jgi:hypothetical protein
MGFLWFLKLIAQEFLFLSYMSQGNVKVGTTLLLLGDSENLKIRNANAPLAGNTIKIQISNDRNIPDTYATSIGP